MKPGHFSNRVELWKAIFLFAVLHVYLASNTISFGFWKSSAYVFEYMLIFYGAWLILLILLLILALTLCRRFQFHRVLMAILVILSIPFTWDLWVRSIEIDSVVIRNVLRLLILPIIYLYFRIGLTKLRAASSVVLLLCIISFLGHAGLTFPIDRSHNFQSIALNKKPNVHVLVLESLTHSQFTKEFMGRNNAAADALASLDDAIHAGALGFSESSSTKVSLNTLFSLAQRDTASFDNMSSMTGMIPSRLTALTRENGYTVTTGYLTGFFGWQKGEWVDHYYRGKSLMHLGHDLACQTRKGRLEFCGDFSESVFSKLFIKDTVDEKRIEREWPDKVFQIIDMTEQNASTPLFSVFHINMLTHTGKGFDRNNKAEFKEFINGYFDNVPRAKEVIKSIDRLRKRHPQSIFIISGDHGPFIGAKASTDESRFKVLGYHSVVLSLLNASNLCAWSRDWLDRQRYLTASRMVAASLACDGESRQLTELFVDDEEFIRFGESYESAL